MESIPTVSLSLDLVLLGSRLEFAPPGLVFLGVIFTAWLGFGAWLWRNSSHCHPRPLAILYGLALAGLFATVLAQDAPLFYTGTAVAGYSTLAILLLVHGPACGGTAAAQTLMLVLGDLILFELLVSLHAQAQTTDFNDFRRVFRDQGNGVSFLGVLLVAAAGLRIAPLLLLIRLPGRLQAWRWGAAPALFCIAFATGVGLLAKLIEPTLIGSQSAYTLLAVSGAALFGYLMAVVCVLGQAGINRAFRRLSTVASGVASLGAQGLAIIGVLSRHAAPRLRAQEQWMLSWPIAVAAATAFAGLLALAIIRAGGS